MTLAVSSAFNRPLPPLASSTLRIVPLGGLGEIGMNALVLEQQDGLVLVDCGVTFPSTDLGIDVLHPRFDYLAARADSFKGVVVTHGHEDHIGALPYLLSAFDVPVCGPPHALELARLRLTEHGFDPGALRLTPIRPGQPFALGPFGFEPIRVAHSIVDAVALSIDTAIGRVIHTGDFKFDASPIDGETTDANRLMALGDEGVELLLSDSTNVDSQGTAASEKDVALALAELIGRSPFRVVLGVFASNVQRLIAIPDIARRTGRCLCFLGRSVGNHVRAAETVGRLKLASDMVVSAEIAAGMARDRVLIVASGTQAERMSALTRLANGTHPQLQLERGDHVLLSSRIIPGNDRPVFDMMADFLRRGVELTTRITDPRVHASGHAHRDEQRRMIELTQPRAFIPVHGTLHHLTRHAALAREAGVDEVLVIENGEVTDIDGQGPPKKVGRTAVGRVATASGDVLADETIGERAQLGRAGIAVVSCCLDQRGVLARSPTLFTRGVLDPTFAGVSRKVEQAVANAIADADVRTRASDEAISDLARHTARRTIEAQTGRRPVVVAAVTRL